LLSVISNPVKVMHSLESVYGNWLLKVFRVLICSRLQANDALLQDRHLLGRALPLRNELSRLRRRAEEVLPNFSSRMREQSDPDHQRRSKRARMIAQAICPEREAP